MKSLYESLLDDEENLLDNDKALIDYIKTWISSNVKKVGGRINVNKKAEIKISGNFCADIIGPIPSYINISNRFTFDSIRFINCSDKDVEKILEKADSTSDSMISIGKKYDGDLSVFNKYIHKLWRFTIDAGAKISTDEINIGFSLNEFMCYASLPNLKTINLSKVFNTIHWSDYPFNDLKGFPTKLKRCVLSGDKIKSFNGGLKECKYIGIHKYNLPEKQQLKYIMEFDEGDVKCPHISIGGSGDTVKFLHNLGLYTILRSGKIFDKNSLYLWKLLISVPLYNDSSYLENYLEKNGGKRVSMEDMENGKNYIIIPDKSNPDKIIGVIGDGGKSKSGNHNIKRIWDTDGRYENLESSLVPAVDEQKTENWMGFVIQQLDYKGIFSNELIYECPASLDDFVKLEFLK